MRSKISRNKFCREFAQKFKLGKWIDLKFANNVEGLDAKILKFGERRSRQRKPAKVFPRVT